LKQSCIEKNTILYLDNIGDKLRKNLINKMALIPEKGQDKRKLGR